MRPKQDIITFLILIVILYLTISGTVYRFRHPEMTETQLVLHLWDWVTWRQ